MRDKTLELARESILKSYKGMQIIKQFNDVELFHTDTIGLGSGPVDYYYDKDTNHTFKYERSFDVITSASTLCQTSSGDITTQPSLCMLLKLVHDISQG